MEHKEVIEKMEERFFDEKVSHKFGNLCIFLIAVFMYKKLTVGLYDFNSCESNKYEGIADVHGLLTFIT